MATCSRRYIVSLTPRHAHGIDLRNGTMVDWSLENNIHPRFEMNAPDGERFESVLWYYSLPMSVVSSDSESLKYLSSDASISHTPGSVPNT